jgi:hypothetical protein
VVAAAGLTAGTDEDQLPQDFSHGSMHVHHFLRGVAFLTVPFGARLRDLSLYTIEAERGIAGRTFLGLENHFVTQFAYEVLNGRS